MAELPKPLDIAPLENAYGKKAQELPLHERFGVGRRYPFGTTNVDVFPSPPGELSPIVSIRLRRGVLTVGDVQDATPTDDGGMTIIHPDGGIDVSKTGDLAMVYVAFVPIPEMHITTDTKVRRDAKGTEYLQDMIEGTEDTEQAEYKRGVFIVGSSPVGVTKRRGAPLRFTVYEKLDDNDPTQEKEWEVKAYNKYVQQVKALKLQPGDKIFLVGVRKHWTNPKAGGGDIEYECLNVAAPIQVKERKKSRNKKQAD